MKDSEKRLSAVLAAAAEWRLIGLLLERPIPERSGEVDRLIGEVRDLGAQAAAEIASGISEGEYLHWIGPGGAVSPREVAYRPMEDPGWILADLARFYEAFAFRPRAEDPGDHLAVECGFVAYLHLKEAYALAAGDREALETTIAARDRFIESHLSTLASAFAERLRELGSRLAPVARWIAERVPVKTPLPANPGTDEPESLCGSCAGPR